MASPLKHKKTSTADDVAGSHSRARLLSPSSSGFAGLMKDDDRNPSPLKKQKRVDSSSSFITSSPQRPTYSSLTPKKPVSRNLCDEFVSQEITEESTVVEAHIQITPPDEKYASLSASSITSFPSTHLGSTLDISKAIITMFSPVFKTLFGSYKSSDPDTNKENINVENHSHVEANDDLIDVQKITELVADEVLPESAANSPKKPEVAESYQIVVEERDQEDAEEQDEEPEEIEEFDPYLFIANLPPLKAIQSVRPAALPSKRDTDPHITLVLDLDETLVHCSTEPIASAELIFPVSFNDQEYQIFVRKRPGFLEFLKAVSKKFEVVIFTASQEVYARRLLELIDPERKYIHHQLYRDSCVNVNGNFLKDLTILGRDLSRVIIVDNSPQTFGFQIDNGIPIESWFDDNDDKELLLLLPFLESIHTELDVRPHITNKYKLQEKVSRYRRFLTS